MNAPRNGFVIIRQCAGISFPERCLLETLFSLLPSVGDCPGNPLLLHELECSKATLERMVAEAVRQGLVTIRRYPVGASWRRQFTIQWDELIRRKRPDYFKRGGDYVSEVRPSPASETEDYVSKDGGTRSQNGGGLGLKSAGIEVRSKASKDQSIKPPPSNAGGVLTPPTPFKGTAGEKTSPTVSPDLSLANFHQTDPPAPSLFTETWRSYSHAYAKRYDVAPLLTGKARAAIKRLVATVGHEAPDIAAYFVRHSKRYYLERGHDPALLEQDAAHLRTQMLTGRTVTTLDAQATERLDTFGEQVKRLVH